MIKLFFAKILIDRDENLSHGQVNFNSFSKLREHFTIFFLLLVYPLYSEPKKCQSLVEKSGFYLM